MKIALFKNTQYDFNTVVICDGEGLCYWDDGEHSYIRISETIDIDFPMLDRQTAVNRQLAAIDKQIQSVRAECEVKIGRLDRQKQELLALPSDKEEV
jgi:hypothetical protein